MDTLDFRSFMVFCKGLEGHTLSTIGGKARFELSKVEDGSLYYIPESTGKKRLVPKRYIQGVLDHYMKAGLLRPVDYTDITRNSSYTLALMKLYLKR